MKRAPLISLFQSRLKEPILVTASINSQTRYNFVLGYYIYAEASSPRQPGDLARLVSPILTGSHCVVFRYHMNGANMGSLRMYGRVGSFEQQVWERSGDQGDTWNGIEFRIDTTAQYEVGKPKTLPHK